VSPTEILSVVPAAGFRSVVFLAALSLVCLYHFRKYLDRRRIEQRKARHHRMLLDLGEARQVVAQIPAPRNGLVTAEDAGRLLPASGWALAESMPAARRLRLAYHIEAVSGMVDRTLDTFLAHERDEVSADDVVFQLERLQAYVRGLSADFPTPAARAAAKGRR
jgi:hypothetical protein